MRRRSAVILLAVLGVVIGCRTLPKDAVVITCKPVIRRGQVGWREGQGRHGLATGGKAIVWPKLVLQDSRITLVIDFADKELLAMLKPDQFYTFAILPPRRDELGMTLPKILWVKKDGKKIYTGK